MKARAIILPTLTLLAAAGLALSGPLSPPAGPVGPTFKALTEIEPRTAINAANTPGDADSVFKITQPGSYYLTGNLQGVVGKSGIVIAANLGGDVTIDLNGFNVDGVFEGATGIVVTGFYGQIAIRNGSIRGWPSGGVVVSSSDGPASLDRLTITQISNGDGIRVRGPATITDCRLSYCHGFGIRCVDQCTISNCAVSNSGNDGISVGTGATVTNSISSGNASEGFSSSGYCVFRGCAASYNDGVGILAGIGSTVVECTAGSSTTEGIRGLPNVSVLRCTANNNGTIGINMLDGGLVEGCSATANGTDGVRLSTSCSALNNQCRGNGIVGVGAGILATGVANRIDGNHCVDNDYGVRTTSSDTLVVRNTARSNASGNFSFVVAGETAQILTNPGANFVATNPWANFAY